MIDGLKPYPKMKDSGVPWLEKIPKHWEVRRLRNVAEMRVSNVDKHTKDDERPVRLCNYVDVYKNDRIIDSMTFMRATATTEEIERFRLEPGDVLITKDSEAWDDIGVPALVAQTADDLICGYHLALLRPRDGLLRGDYLFRVLQSKPVAYQFHVEANGVTRFGLSHAAIKSISLPLPPFPEQAAIVRFLDYADRRIGQYIRSKQKLIKLLEEQKQAIVYEAVTGQIDVRTGEPYHLYKLSGIEWLGDIPNHWTIMRGKAIFAEAHQAVQDDDEIVTCFRDGQVTLRRNRRITGFMIALKEVGYQRVRRGQLVIHAMDAFAGAAGVSDSDGKCSPEYIICEPRVEGTVPAYFAHCLRIAAKLNFIQVSCPAVRERAPRLRYPNFGQLLLPFPEPSEQSAIVAFAFQATANLTGAIDRAQHEISLLKEYRTRLIADLVTGKLDVREAAAQLPDEAVKEIDSFDVDEEAAEEADGIDDPDLEGAALEAGA